jgi:nucleoside-diphosphate-sugar epimerase
MNVFVTGAAGFIGGSIATGLVRPGIGHRPGAQRRTGG